MVSTFSRKSCYMEFYYIFWRSDRSAADREKARKHDTSIIYFFMPFIHIISSIGICEYAFLPKFSSWYCLLVINITGERLCDRTETDVFTDVELSVGWAETSFLLHRISTRDVVVVVLLMIIIMFMAFLFYYLFFGSYVKSREKCDGLWHKKIHACIKNIVSLHCHSFA